MRKKEIDVRSRVVKLRMNESEVFKLKQLQQQSMERTLSNYIRKVALQKPVLIKYRNQSADDFLTVMIQLKKELNAIGNNFNQAVHQLHRLDQIPQFRSWLKTYQGLHETVVATIQEIQLKMNQLYEQWLQK